jgi:hypothetical protein
LHASGEVAVVGGEMVFSHTVFVDKLRVSHVGQVSKVPPVP